MKLHIKSYPWNADAIFCIGIDDLHPESDKDVEHIDFGSSSKKAPLQYIAQAIQEYPQLKFSIFTTPQWIDRSDMPSGLLFPLRKIWRRRRRYSEGTFDITQKRFGKWVNEINSFYPKNIEIAPHGLFHHNDNTKYFRSEEFGGLSKEEMQRRLKKSEDLFARAKLKHSKGFRPPGWYIDQTLLNVLQSTNYLYTAANADMESKVIASATAKKTGQKKQSLLYPTKSKKLYNFTANCYPKQIDRALDILKYNGLLLLHSHIAQTEWGLISLSKKFPKQIKSLLQEISYQTIAKPWYATLEEVAQFLYAKEKISWKIQKGKISFMNNSTFDLKGLTVVIDRQTIVIEKIAAGSTHDYHLVSSKMTKVSIILTVYNGEKTIEASLKSLIHQTYPNVEILVINDGSTDATEKIAKKVIDENKNTNICLISQQNKGRAVAKNTGLKRSTGEFIAFCEDDAIYTKDYIENAVSHFKKKDIVGVIGPHYVLNKNENLLTRAKDLERRRNFYHYKPFSAWVYKKEILDTIGGFDEELEFGEDIAPAIKIKELFPSKKFVFEPACKWFHKEPSTWQKNLSRKCKGGIGISFLHRKEIKKFTTQQKLATIVAPLIVLSIFGVFILELFFSVYVLFGTVVLFTILLLLVRKNDITLSRKISSERIYMIVLSIFIEYFWWIATLIGIYIGILMPLAFAKSILRKR